ncbi:MAG: hypothetical protein WC711_02015 [Candidatus Staskawiczbacteria bacterium]|jgi:hypothetical protein
MNKLFLKNISILSVIFFFTGASQIYAEIPGRYLTADVGAADLMGIASKYPTLFWSGLFIFLIICLGYGIYYLVKRNKK